MKIKKILSIIEWTVYVVLFLLFACAVSCTTLSCCFVQDSQIEEFSMPQNVENVDYWLVFYSDGKNDFGSEGRRVKSEEHLFLEHTPNTATAILAYPVKNGIQENPYGTILPYKSDFTDFGGFSAYISHEF